MSEKLSSQINGKIYFLYIVLVSDKSSTEERWAKKIWKIYKIQLHMERQKHMQPYFTEYFQDFA